MSESVWSMFSSRGFIVSGLRELHSPDRNPTKMQVTWTGDEEHSSRALRTFLGGSWDLPILERLLLVESSIKFKSTILIKAECVGS